MSEMAKSRRVMFVDDDAALVMVTRLKLGRLGHEVSGYEDAESALAAFLGDPAAFDLVVTDVSLGGMSGFELAARILAARPDVPVVIASGAVSAEDEARAGRCGARAIIVKSELFQELARRLATLA